MYSNKTLAFTILISILALMGLKQLGNVEDLTIYDHRMDDGWIAALSYIESLKILKISSRRRIDASPGPEKLLRSCPAMESLQLKRCCLNDKEGMRDCWGLNGDSFSLAKAFRRVRFLSLKGCSVLTSGGLESVILHWGELESMRVVSCKSIKDSEISRRDAQS
ncbi:hypothetical protein ARALYDRAFT_899534 [Arabidopsis lyrata subsp. lyrata]|uniref:Leucine-rich repeat family protein n=1 Tax=Arabidopsis lyrata subsp. lyrata TaxID=81972 RepID=D7LB58_ARALL|nr:hypothetical protein ARALYDRAFT_899534 [Arabidopsis lyrata subsp. lyrata]